MSHLQVLEPLPKKLRKFCKASETFERRGNAGKALISWKTKKQPTVAHSTAEVENRSLGGTVCELQWISFLAKNLHIFIPTRVLLYYDNQAALVVANPNFHELTKHLEIDCHLV
ncbi:UNVERIFIED_CONTAM: hypothetical protein Slati_0510100 [Sesamum latifolium]|uniref:Uncharacterized protein n=1 Tax=Sesamum latifolium TaxID=2727402 RepID=A0AAW2XXS7_9LAMI